MAKRGNNEGSVFKRKNGTWRAMFTVDGRRLSFNAKTRREAQDWIRRMQDQVDIGLSYKSSQITFEKFINDWLVTIESSVRPATFKQYNQYARNHISPYLGKYKLMELRPKHIQQRYNEMVKEGKGLRTVQYTHIVIHGALKHAVKLGLIPRNPDDATTPPRPKPKEMKFLDEAQAQRFLFTAKENGDKYFALYHLAIASGMRMGEIVALRWSDLDVERGTLKIQRQLTLAKGGGFEYTTPKTKAGRRTIQLGASTLKILREHSQQQFGLMQQAGNMWQEHNLIFTSSIGTAINKDNLRKSFKKSLKNADLSMIRFHDLRHTAASLMLNHGIPVMVVSRRLGHAKPSITMDIYGHLIPGRQQEAADLMDELLIPIEVSFE